MKKVTKGSKNRLEKELGFRSFGKSLCVSPFFFSLFTRVFGERFEKCAVLKQIVLLQLLDEEHVAGRDSRGT